MVSEYFKGRLVLYLFLFCVSSIPPSFSPPSITLIYFLSLLARVLATALILQNYEYIQRGRKRSSKNTDLKLNKTFYTCHMLFIFILKYF